MHVVTAPRIEHLAELLAERITSDPLPPLEHEVVVIAQNTGLRDWVETYLARRLGCAASLHLVSPRGLAAELARAVVPTPPATDAQGRPIPRDSFEREGLQWRLAALLPHLPHAAPYAALHAYGAEAGEAGPRLLAARLARLFDDYQVYRPDVLDAWARGDTHPEDHEHAVWQAPLWRRLVAEIEAPDRAARLEALVEALETAPSRPRGCPPRVTVFGALLFPPLPARPPRSGPARGRPVPDGPSRG